MFGLKPWKVFLFALWVFSVNKSFSYAPFCKQKSNIERPNVILLMTDDQGYGELSIHGNPILQTPNLDKLHHQSIRLIDFHVAPMCTPTRGQLITGQDAVRNGAVNVSSGRALLRSDVPTIGDLFSEAGYRTGIFGKWHLGDNYPYRPEDRGFQETLWFPSSHIGSVPDYWGNDYFDDTYINNGKRRKYKGYCTNVFFDEAIRWMSEKADYGEPFLAYIPTNAPHQPFYAPEEYIREMEAVVENSPNIGMAPGKKHDFIRYLAMIRHIDNNVEKLIEFLDEKGLSQNTILIFMTDNGSTFGPDYYNAGMRGRKTQLYEGGHRVPFFIKWPAGNLRDPADITGLAQVQDVLPTLLDLCDISIPETVSFDGINLAPVLRGERTINPDRHLIINYSRMPFYFSYPSPYTNSKVEMEGAGVLWKKWRLLNTKELYNLAIDPFQKENVIDRYPAIVDTMMGFLIDWWASVGRAANKPSRVVIGSELENPTLLSACEWMDVFVDQQTQVERGVRKNSYWLLEVKEAGAYEFELRRWPREVDWPVSYGNSKHKKLPIAFAKIYIKGEDYILNQQKAVEPEHQKVLFTHRLDTGPIALHTWFSDSAKEDLCGAYYVYVTKVK